MRTQIHTCVALHGANGLNKIAVMCDGSPFDVFSLVMAWHLSVKAPFSAKHNHSRRAVLDYTPECMPEYKYM